MKDARKEFVYTNSLLPIEVGDHVSVDDHSGVVKRICFAGTQDARDYSCEKTGGILIKYDDGILALEPLGFYEEIQKIEGS